MTPTQLRAARKVVGLTRFRLGQLSGVSPSRIEDFERTGEMPTGHKPSQTAENRILVIRTALKAAGVMFTNGDEPSARLRQAAE